MTLAVVILPPKGMVTLISEAFTTVNVGQTFPFSFTCVAPEKPDPLMLIIVPVTPQTEESEVSTGVLVTVIVLLLVPLQTFTSVTVTV